MATRPVRPPRPTNPLQVGDHTAIVKWALEQRGSLGQLPKTVDAFLRAGAKTAPVPLKSRLTLAATEVRSLRLFAAKLPRTDPYWLAIMPVAKKIAAHDGDVNSLLAFLRVEAAAATDHVKIGLDTAIDLLVDGSGTIYSSDEWMEQIMDPRQILGELSMWGGKLEGGAGGVVDGIKGIAVDDVVGAVAGAAAGAANGARAGGGAGAAAGAVAGAITGGIGNSVKSAIA